MNFILSQELNRLLIFYSTHACVRSTALNIKIIAK